VKRGVSKYRVKSGVLWLNPKKFGKGVVEEIEQKECINNQNLSKSIRGKQMGSTAEQHVRYR
jgi:hypothetical protein